ncbi:PREDICTED: CAP-Gly domain-containing linker protein 1 homolog [Nicrophorus vespilloides]|uniref:CAP-Gly domain-containing linker protein 1 homolog n=1 Tax=Nicrophorus vespilloides TaxID=110193 RepID=A0ABM1MLB6_NICVS|nr:PREDICTED: CAP-Gly domain-containing linker protein 1 homolog [Nicrophorus vespilloides]
MFDVMNMNCRSTSGSVSSKHTGSPRRSDNMNSRMSKLKEKLKGYTLCHLRKEVKKLRKNVETSSVSYQQLEEYLDLERHEHMMLQREFASYQQKQDEIIQQKHHEYNELRNHYEERNARNEDMILELTDRIKSMDLEMREKNMVQENDCKNFVKESVLEVTSLQAVLEMKQEEIRQMRVKMMTLQSKVDLLPETENLLGQLKLRCEDLECQIMNQRNAKMHLELDNNKLRQLHELESKERDTLMMMNEMLKWKLQKM